MRTFVLCVMLAAAAVAASATFDRLRAEPLPGKASSLRETYDDWIVSCVAREAETSCAMSQIQIDRKTGKRVISFELRSTGRKKATGVLLMPFGLALGKAVRLKVDEKERRGGLPFSTCLPAGCVVPVAVDASLLASLKAGTTLGIDAVASESEQPVAFSISLAGFSPALERLAEFTN